MMKLFFIILPIYLIPINLVNAGHRSPIYAKTAMVATADTHATQTGIQILKRGGNAIDAAVAIGFVLAVTYPQAGNIGGGGFMMIRTADGQIFALDYREKAPLKAQSDMYLDENEDVIQDASVVGYLASGVPGTVNGLFAAHQRFGSMAWADLVSDAIQYASSGFIINRYMGRSFYESNEELSRFESTKKIFTKSGAPYIEGDTLVQEDLAKTLRYIQQHGSKGFYSGPVAAQIVAEMKANQGLISQLDLELYESIWRNPIEFQYRTYDVFAAPPPSSGGILLAEILNALENTQPDILGHNSSALIHLLAEIEKQAYRDRANFLGDPDFFSIPLGMLTSKTYGLRLFRNINPFCAQSLDGTELNLIEHSETTHFSIVDALGNAVSNTYTLNSSFGAGVVIEGTGILMNNEMDDFSIKPGYANIYGLIGSTANKIVPAKRMLSSMTPTIVTYKDSLHALLGSPGGATIITTVAQVLSNIIDHRMNIRESIEAPRFHHQWLPDSLRLENLGFSKDVQINLEKRGHILQITDAIGDVQGILFDRVNEEWTGWSDPRGNGICIGF